ncbi:cupin domain-containing protein [Bradyrhizobium sp. sBnM-33]
MPPHTHPYSEVVTVISGDDGSSHGEKLEKKGDLLKPGSLWVHPAKHAHYAWTGSEEGILQVQFIGPASITSIRLTIRANSSRSHCKRPPQADTCL